MNAEILAIGSEILLGDIVNTNGAFLAQELAALGIDIYHQSVVGDNAQRLRESLELSLSRADIVITTGGLGPTYDDLTKKTVADYFGLSLELHAPSVEKIEALFASLNREMTPNNLLQAEVPLGAVVFFNDTGFAPGIAVEQGGKTVIMLPGPPGEMKPMFRNKVVPFLQKDQTSTLRSQKVNIFGLGESLVEEKLRDIMTTYTNPTIAPYAKQVGLEVRVSAKAKDAEAADALIDPVVEQIKQRLGSAVYGVDVGSLQNAVVTALRAKGLTLATAESCTGGALSQAITSIAGASEVFHCGLVTYSNDMKIKLLGVDSQTLLVHGAVSEQTAQQMASGVRALSGADIGIGITGIAGPGGGTDEKPVGLVYISVNSDALTTTKKLNLYRGHISERAFIQRYATLHALSLILTATGS
ncbi:MAG: competence/damage-inducible protein A [Clostridia bacterium]|jgi:nicotinamide-nucleotide amidase|nr:competence/damage-inducible protein A [Clostridia bacterium]MBT7121470.1 competence/damage-inducible protein A [Clostridia bacterium]